MEQNVPVKEGEVYDVEVGAVGAKGDGICRVKGFVIFVPNVQKGDFVQIRIKKVLAKAAFGEFVKKVDKPTGGSSKSYGQQRKKFATVKASELKREPIRNEFKTDVEETDDFGSEIEDDDEM
jgi:predicted RNA-binding protein with TRAM domain